MMIAIDQGGGGITSYKKVNRIFPETRQNFPACFSQPLLGLQPQPRQQRISFAEPRTLPPPLVSRHARPFVENFLSPLASLVGTPLRLQKESVVVVSLGARGGFRSLLKQSFGFFRLSGLRVGMSEQPLRAL